MCGRTRCTLTAHQVAQACGLNAQDASSVPTHQIDRYRPTYNVSPGTYLPVFRVRRSSSEGGEAAAAAALPVVHCMKWGLIPSFTKKTEKPDHYRMFNARSESIKEKASFKRLIPNNRCLVAVEGFYEWKKDGSKKQPYYIHFKDNRALVFAALYDFWENSEGEVLHTFTILTTRSSSALEWLHDRMPVILRDTGSINLWLNDPSAKLETILGPCEDPDLVWYPVSSAMGKPSFDGPECIEEIQLKPAGEKPISMFFTKKAKVKSEPEILKSSKQEDNLNNVIEEPGAEDTEEKITEEEKNDHIESENCGIKREFEETKTASRLTHENIHTKHISPAPKKGKNIKNTGDNQASLLSYFVKRDEAYRTTSILPFSPHTAVFTLASSSSSSLILPSFSTTTISSRWFSMRSTSNCRMIPSI